MNLELYRRERGELDETLYAHALAAECAAEIIVECVAKCDGATMVKVVWDAKKMLVESLEVVASMCMLDAAIGEPRVKAIASTPRDCLSVLQDALLFDFFLSDSLIRRKEIDVDELQVYVEESLAPRLRELFKKLREAYGVPRLDEYIKPPSRDIHTLANDRKYLERVASVLQWPMRCTTVRRHLDEVARIVEEHVKSGGT